MWWESYRMYLRWIMRYYSPKIGGFVLNSHNF